MKTRRLRSFDLLRSALALLTLALVSGGCPAAENPPDDTPRPSVCPLAQQTSAAEGSLLVPAVDDVAFAPREGWPTDAPMRQLGTGFMGDISQLEVDARGCIWVLWSEGDDEGAIRENTQLQIHGLEGPRLRTLAREDNVHPRQFVLHPSGEVTLFELVKQPGGRSFRLRLRRLSEDGRLLTERFFEDAGRPEERVLYATQDGSLVTRPVEGDMSVWVNTWGSHIRAVAQGEEVLFLAWTYGVKLYRLDASLRTQWDVQVMPDNDSMVGLVPQELLTLDAQGNALVAWTVRDTQAEAYRRHFSRAVPWEDKTFMVLVQRYSPQGAFQYLQTLGHAGTVLVSGMAVRGDELLLGADVLITKHDRPNDTLESEFLLLRGNLKEGAQTLARVMDVSREDYLEDFKMDARGACYFAGITDALQADSNSVVEYGQGIIMKTSEDGVEREVLRLPGPRHVRVRRIALAPQGGVVFAGTFDGFITHTPKNEQHQRTMLGYHRF
ncbi:hypothetical protein P2318_24815 [Myxococcaceae bacterium GXIMD 01537]